MLRFVAAFICLLGLGLAQARAQVAPTIAFSELDHQAGRVHKDKAPVQHEFKFKNLGNIPISILRVETDCACTTSNYTTTPVYPNEHGSITVQYDPVRPGPYEKKFTIVTDAYPRTHELVLRGYVMPSASDGPQSMFVYQIGKLRFQYKYLNLGTIHPGQKVSKRFEIYNNGKTTVKFKPKILAPSHLSVFFDTSNLIAPKQIGAIVVAYDPKAKGSGYFQETITLFTDDPLQPKLEMTLLVNVRSPDGSVGEAAPSAPRPEVVANGPRLRLSELEQNLGNIYLGVSTVTEFVLQNEGSAPLEVQLKPEADCEIMTETKLTIAPQEFAVVQVRFKHGRQTGPQTRRFQVLTNDPQNADLLVVIQANVLEE
ncbi:MAG: DUF1573 domain-containing protein [Bernardetiaceae bacterium]|jgi:hypothetical protein|nr:DUF1573 domain-containing protein [Bernardetiaceae bacterium]